MNGFEREGNTQNLSSLKCIVRRSYRSKIDSFCIVFKVLVTYDLENLRGLAAGYAYQLISNLRKILLSCREVLKSYIPKIPIFFDFLFEIIIFSRFVLMRHIELLLSKTDVFMESVFKISTKNVF